MRRLPAIQRLDLFRLHGRDLHTHRALLRFQRLIRLKNHIPRLIRLHLAAGIALQRIQIRQVARYGIEPQPLSD
jgi:hypothetical protein